MYYDVKKHLDTEGQFERRPALLSQIYNTLKRMVDDDLVTFVEEARDSKLDLKIYSLTAQGREYLIDFLHIPLEHTCRHSETSLMFRVRYAFLIETSVTIRNLRDELAYRQEQIRTFRHRDRTIKLTLLSADELTCAQAIADELHNYGADRMDVYVAHLQQMISLFEKKCETEQRSQKA